MSSEPLAPIAIIGISAELPSGDYSEENLDFQMFKKFLHEKRDSYGRVPAERFNVDLWRGKNAGHIFTDTGSFLKDISMFDYLEFGINPKDAKALAVGTRRLIENSFLALWDAGIQYRGRNIGTYMSAVAHDILSVGEHAPTDAAGSFAGAYTMVANKVAYHLDLCGPSLPVDTACSSTATATHLAVQAIRAGECEAAVVGGCQVNSRFIDIICYSQGGVLAPDGMCKPFDAGANGFSRGEGCVAIVLKPLDKAIADGDYIYGSILGTGINATGNSAPVYAPLASAQEDAMRKAYVGTGRTPQEVDFIELHATGTSVGDPIEANWVGKAFARDDELLIGSVKGNIGHTEIVSFMASLCKVLWIFQDHVVPPNVKLNKLNQKVKWKQWKLRVPTESEPIRPRHSSGKLLISMNSSGIGGSNAHVLVESHKPSLPLPNEIPSKYPALLLAGALSDSSTSAVAKELVNLADGNKDIAALALSFGRRSMQMNWRSFAVTLPGATPSFSSPRFIPRNRPALVWVCSGQGPQHIAMGRQLFNQFPVFRDSILELDSVYLAATGESMIARTGLFSNKAAPKLPAVWPIEITLPAIAMVQLGLIDLYRSLGIVPDAVVGHSAGETTMMYASGATSKAMALEVAIARGLAVAELEALEGSMVAFSCDPIVADDIIDEVRASIDAPNMILDVACYNAETAVVLAGHVLLLEKAKEIAKARNIMVNQIATRVPFHSTMMEACKASYLKRVSAVFAKYRAEECIPKIPAYSTMTGEIWRKAFTADYFWDNARSPVEFLSAINTILVDMPNATFLEISPHPVLSSYVSSIRGTSDVVFCGMRRKREYTEFGEYTQLLEAVGGLAVTGYDSIDLRALTGVRSSPIPSPFKYPFSKKDVPVYSDVCRTSLDHMDATYRGPLCSSPLRINSATHPDLTQHVINSQPIMAAAGFLEMGFELGGRTLWNVNFRTMLPLIADKTISVEIKREDSRWSVCSYKPGSLDELRLHTDGFLSAELTSSPPTFKIAELQKGRKVIEAEEFYAPINHFAQYGPMFRRVTRFWRGANEGLAEIRGFAPDLTEHGYNYIVHPAILDACFHAMVLPASADNDPNSYHLPLSVEYVALHQPSLFPQGETPADTFFAYVKLKNWTPEEIKFDLEILLPSGQSVLSLHGFSVAHHEKVTGITNAQSFELIYQPYMLPEWSAKKIQSATGNGHATNGYTNGGPSDAVKNVQPAIKAAIDFAVQGGKKVVRVLEVGAASSQLLSQRDIAALIEHPSAADIIVHYTCADSSSVSIPPFAHYTKFDVANPEAGLLSTFDLVLACGVEAADDTASNLSKLLLPGGLLIVVNTDTWKNSLKTAGFVVVSGLGKVGIAQKARMLLSSEPFVESAIVEYPSTANADPNSLLELQGVFNHLRQSGQKELWLHANSDETSGSAAGFTRVLRVEVPDLNLYLVFFDNSWGVERRAAFIHSIAHLPNLDKEFEVDISGNILVPRYVPSAIPNASLTEETTISPDSVVPPSDIPEQHILVKTDVSGEAQSGYKGIVGTVYKSCSSQWKEGDRVVGVVSVSQKDFPTPYVVAHEGQFASLPTTSSSHAFAFLALPIAVIGIALGVSNIRDLRRLRRWKVGVVGLMNEAICDLLVALGVNAKVASTKPEERSLAALRDSDLVIASGLGKNDLQTIRGTVRPQTSVFVWDDPATGLNTELSRNPWLVGDVISEFVTQHSSTIKSLSAPVKASATETPVTKSLFRADRSYLLVGGIGSMGMKIALWMYENGARNIVMTSRSGSSTLNRPRYEAGKRIAGYAKDLPGLNLRLEACDGASSKAMSDLISSLSLPLAGVMLLSASINDRLFSAHDEDSWSSPFISKVHVFKALEAACSLESLDFIIAFSSATILGSLGQANYAGANSAVDYLVRKLPNAFSIVCPAILDSVLFEATNELNTDVTRWSTWGMTCSELCHHIRLGLLKMRQQPFYLYVPPWSWDKASAGLGTACLPMFYHLFSDDAANGGSAGKKDASADVIKNIVLSFLDVAEDDFSMSTPLTAYGLDSLSAGHLSVALRPYLQIAQMQLLSDITTEDIVKLTTQGDGDEDDEESSDGAVASKLVPVIYSGPSVQEKRYDWQRPPNQPGETLIKLIDRPGETPLIFTHGGGGNLLTFVPLQEHFKSALWGVQVTPETPLESVERTAKFYYEKIKEAQPHGPYRIGGYCASALIAYELVYQFQQAGDEISQWVMLDFSPAIFGSYHFTTGLDEETIKTRVPTKDVIGIGIRLMDRMTELDTNEGAKTVIAEIWDAHNGLPARDHIKVQHRAFSGIGLGALDLFFKLSGNDEKVLRNPAALEQRMIEWAARVKVPMQLVLPRQSGARSLFPDGDPAWEMLGTERFAKNFERFDVNGGHLTMMEDPKLAQFLENGGRK
ncbi:putative polyketide synthase [Lentinula raphanica]|uniref:Polyketide synthase n=1 Tax=Lentinula raphanica TaxID=153919 RepID=A0AA38PC54_9AGAR|nr:putative polyketide synthase [Lentinula raphanica]KAJ3972109.1 putative polyketide synthase [Lentinula raphanica]